jgi:hypothetical protein
MLLSTLLRPAPVVLMFAMLSANGDPARAQSGPPRPDSSRAAGPLVVPPRLQRATAGRDHAALATVRDCHLTAACFTLERAHAPAPVAKESRRGTFALVGLVAGAAAGWGWYAYRCGHGDDCYSPVGGVLLAAAGGVIGLLVGLLIAPTPEPH